MQIYCYKFEGNETYIGMTTRDINIRFDEHCADMSNGTHHSHKVQQTYYLYNKFPNLTVLDSANSLDELKSKEVYWIAKFNTFDKGLNCTRGGDTIYEGKLLQDDYLAIVTFLAYTNFTSKEIANELNVPYSIVNNISSGYTHSYLAKVIPLEYSLMLAKIGTRNKKIHSNELYHQILLDLVTTNKTYEEISKIYGVNKSIIAGISSGYKHTYLRDEYPELYTKLIKIRGSRKQGNYKAVEYTVVSPELISYTFTNISEFARQNNLDIGSLNRLVHKKAKSHKGWKLQDA